MRGITVVLAAVLLVSSAVVATVDAGSHCGAKGDWRSELVPDRWPPPKARQGWMSRFGQVDIVPIFKACKKHDICYDKPELSRKQCDDRFLRDMQRECDKSYQNFLEAPLKEACYQAAQGYYQAVSKFGGPAFAAARAGKTNTVSKKSEVSKKKSETEKNKTAGTPLIKVKPWGKLEGAKGIVAMHGKLFAYKPESCEIWVSPLKQCQWELFCTAPKATLLAAGKGRLYLWDNLSGKLSTTHINKRQWKTVGNLKGIGSFAYCGHELVCRLAGSGDLMAAQIWKLEWRKIGSLPEPSVVTSFGGRLYALSMEKKELAVTHTKKLVWKTQSRLNRFGLPAIYSKQLFLLDPSNGEISFY